jgi:hypothetical protein
MKPEGITTLICIESQIMQSSFTVMKKSNVPTVHADQKRFHIYCILFMKYTCRLIEKITCHGLKIPTCATPKRHHSDMLGYSHDK